MSAPNCQPAESIPLNSTTGAVPLHLQPTRRKHPLNSTNNRPLDTPPPICHPDRSEAQGRDLQFHSTCNQRGRKHPLNSTNNPPLDTPPPICHPDRSEAQGRDLQFHSTCNQRPGRSIHILVIQLTPQVFRGGHADELNHPQRIRGDLPATVVADLALTGAGHDQNLGNIVHPFHLGNKKLARARFIAHACSPPSIVLTNSWL